MGERAAGILVQDVEVVTVTDTSAVVTWFTGSADETDRYGRPAPVATDTELLLGEPFQPDTFKPVLHDETPTAYHHAEVTGLEPGRMYGYQARSRGVGATPTSVNFPGTLGSLDPPGFFATLAPPPGELLFTVALSNDIHYGERISGVVAMDFPPGVEQEPGLPPYPDATVRGMIADLRSPDRGADRLIVAGDLTSEGGAADSTAIRAILDGYGTLGSDYFVARGNHDRPRAGGDAACGTVASAPDHHDCWADTFPYPWQTMGSYDVGGLRVVGLDTTTLDDPNGTMTREQLGELALLLREDRDRPTLVFGHHPVTVEAAVTTAAGPGFDLDQGVARELEALYADVPGVFLHHAGHTHRNKRTRALPGLDGAVPETDFLEVAAVKEYPAGYTLVRVYTGGYMANFYKTRDPEALRWSQVTRHEYFGLWSAYSLGTVADRNFTATRDLSGLTTL